ncbi:flavin reductase family protein [Elioraea rosea]|uniref:flavin reductase family protein n=1 Tax=Elioraea rosea TaxID=2492390 RepID=UPI0011823635|nr:flavin reductase family protein [Elioraea rosea]
MLFDCASLSPENTYKLLVSTVVPRPIAWVTTLDENGTPNAAPYSFFNAMSGSPPVVAIGIGPKREGLKDTGENIRRAREFVVNLVTDRTAEAMNVTAIDFPAGVNELAEAGLTTAKSSHVAPPRIAESPVAVECRLHTLIELGQGRAVVLGEVLAFHIDDACVLDPARCYIDTPRLGLIGRMHGAGGYLRTTDRLEMPRISLAAWQQRGAAE